MRKILKSIVLIIFVERKIQTWHFTGIVWSLNLGLKRNKKKNKAPSYWCYASSTVTSCTKDLHIQFKLKQRTCQECGLTTQPCPSPSFVWSLLCICHRNALPFCWIWRSSRWCSRCLRRRCTPCAGCTWLASRSYDWKQKYIREDFSKTSRPQFVAHPITLHCHMK